MDAPPRPNRRNGLLRARRNIAYHYDLGNELFELMLDPTMTYSCAVFEDEDEPLEDAQRRKLRRICDKLGLGPDDRVLEIGCGWGGFAILAAAGVRGARHRAHDLAARRRRLARERISAAGLDDRIEIREEDYRSHRGGPYTKVASIEMLEAIGEKQFGTYFATIDRLLAPGGRACVQTILVPDDRWDRYRKSPDWIERYVFPGCLIPSLGALATASARSSNLMIHEVEEIGPSYAETLKRWREAFIGKIDQVRALGYDRRFERTWIFYLSYCEAAFRLARAPRRPADLLPLVRRMKRPPLYTFLEVIRFRWWFSRIYRIHVTHQERVPTGGPGDPRRQPRVDARPLDPRDGNAAPDPLHGQGRAVRLSRPEEHHAHVRDVPRRARDRRPRRRRTRRRAARRRPGPRHVPAGDEPAPSQPALDARRRPARARIGNDDRPGLHRRQREGPAAAQVQARPAEPEGDGLRADRGREGTSLGRDGQGADREDRARDRGGEGALRPARARLVHRRAGSRPQKPLRRAQPRLSVCCLRGEKEGADSDAAAQRTGASTPRYLEGLSACGGSRAGSGSSARLPSSAAC